MALTATTIAQKLGMKINKVSPCLADLGLLERYEGYHGRKAWRLTAEGRKFGFSKELETCSDGSPMLSISWRESVVELLSEQVGGALGAQQAMLAQAADLNTVEADLEFEPGTEFVLQPKLNGIRAIWNPDRQALFTRNGKKIRSVPHIVAELKRHELGHLPLDGEIYRHDSSFQVINGLAARHRGSDETEVLQFHVFDIAQAGMPATARLEMVSKLTVGRYVRVVESQQTNDLEVIQAVYEGYLGQGYEGIMLRLAERDYRSGRSHFMYKMKPVFDLEATLIGFAPAKAGSCNESTFGSLILRLDSGQVFNCAGLSAAERLHLADVAEKGCRITVAYGAMSEAGVPLFPRYKGIRWDL